MSYLPRLKETYKDTILPALQEEFKIANIMAVPKIEKVVINMGLGEGTRDGKIIDEAFEELAMIAGQRPKITQAKKSIANFKLRQGMKVGIKVTLRGSKMWDFLDRLLNIALPRVRDFRGVSRKSFDGRGNYNLGIRDELIFPEIDYSKITQTKGMNITIVTSAEDDEKAFALLKQLGMPFAK
ncbi:MAG TPA: 50S ribosomal protein L5 [Thermoanaerobaculia bacterium]|nr:50S ribosomal protein L5 [Thermoanaerobaculia bacterium]HUM30650.1 50S ribosomal protein L5 [Thermoanaerobaculia bacterium]HXK68942.1 50S ribosomal protein L5 [Thermoanaerobaculia bacterium]